MLAYEIQYATGPEKTGHIYDIYLFFCVCYVAIQILQVFWDLLLIW